MGTDRVVISPEKMNEEIHRNTAWETYNQVCGAKETIRVGQNFFPAEATDSIQGNYK